MLKLKNPGDSITFLQICRIDLYSTYIDLVVACIN